MATARPTTRPDEQRLALAVTPAGHLVLRAGEATDVVTADVAARLEAAFARGGGAGLVQLGAAEVTTELPPSIGFWRDLARRYVAGICARGEEDADGTRDTLRPPDGEVLAALAASAPPMLGGEYVTGELLAAQWRALDAAFREAVAAAGGKLGAFLRAQHGAWHLVGRVHFNLAENRGDDEAPFAFLATYTTRIAKGGRAQHVPLGQALREYAGARATAELQALLTPVRRAAEACPWLADLVESQEIFHPLRWTPHDALQLLGDVGKLEQAGVVVRMPAQWSGGRPARVQAGATVGARKAAGLGRDALLDFRASATIDGEPLTDDEVAALLAGTDGLRLLRGRWVEIDRERLRATIDRLRAVERMAKGGLGFGEAMRLVAGAAIGGDAATAAVAGDARIVAGPWLAERLAALRHPDGLAAVDPGPALRAELRPYQEVGLRWLHLMSELGLGACLADDMGLGKTVQAIAVMLDWRRQHGNEGCILIVCPVSVLGNWRRELQRFAPSMRVVLHHGKGRSASVEDFQKALFDHDVMLTSYNLLQRDEEIMSAVTFSGVILDEAQNIKNPTTRQSRVARALRGHFRMALSGTPLENRPLDLWSIMDFLNEGLLGTRTQFTQTLEHPIVKQRRQGSMSALARLVRPFVLRRLKTDPEIVADLPEKTEQIVSATLSREQAILYESVVRKGLQEVEKAGEGIQRRGAILTTLLRLKQVCNHPAHYLMDGSSLPSRSGKLDLLSEMIEEAIEEGDRCLVFTQFKEMGSLLKTHLENSFGGTVLFLHGGVTQKERDQMVTDFQESRPEGPKVFVLSLKAGGTGLNLTAANRVFHFDRWWNPAVEDQATDRAFRIGQQRNVFVHKFVCSGTLEERIHVFVHKFVCNGTLEERIQQMLERKREVADNLLAAGENWITELSNEELKRLLVLDRKEALA